jgi:hypothetical protein
MKSEKQIEQQYYQILPSLDERGRREWAASEAMTFDHGGIAIVNRATGLSRPTIRRGIDDLQERRGGDIESPRRVRQSGAGRPTPEPVKTHDFKGELGRVSPYGVYDIGDNEAWVSVGISADTAEFAVQSLRRWWQQLAQERYGSTREIFVTADCGGSNGYRSRLWKLELQALSDELGIAISVSHFPPGTSKWNRIEHRLFSFITLNWRGKPLHDYRTVVKLIGATKTKEGLGVHCELDQNTYEKGRKVTKEEMASINLYPNRFHGEWNYTIKPRE